MMAYNKEINDRYRDYFKKYLNNIDSEHSKQTKKWLFSESSVINRATAYGRYKRVVYDLNMFLKNFGLNADKIIKADHDGIDIYIENEMNQSIQISIYQPEYHSNIFMVAYFKFDDYMADCQYDLYPGKNHEFLDECISTFRKLLDFWINEVIYKFNETLGIEATFGQLLLPV